LFRFTKIQGKLSNMFKKLGKSIVKPGVFAPKTTRAAGFSAPKKIDPNLSHYDLVIVGGYTGSYLATHMKHHHKNMNILIIDGRKNIQHTLAYHSVMLHNTEKERDCVAALGGFTGVDIGKESNYATKFEPEKNKVTISTGREVTYENLVLCPGLEYDLDGIKGLRQAFEDTTPGSYNLAVEGFFDPKKLDILREHHFKYFQGNYVFWAPKLPYRGEGTSTSMIFPMFAETKNHRALGRTPQDPFSKIFCVTADDKEFFKVPETNEYFLSRAEDIGASVNYHTDLLEVNNYDRVAKMKDRKSGDTFDVNYDSMYVIPPSSVNEHIKKSPFLNKNGLIDVDVNTLQHNKYKNVFAFGDAADLPTVKSFFAAWNQSFYLGQNLSRVMKGQAPNAFYDGWSIWPIYLKTNFTGYGCNTFGYNPTSWHHMGVENSMMSLRIAKGFQKKLVQVFTTKKLFGDKWFGKPYKNKYIHKIYDKYPEVGEGFQPPTFNTRTNSVPKPNVNDYNKYNDASKRGYWANDYKEIEEAGPKTGDKTATA